MTKAQIIAEKVAITFIEAAITYLAVAPSVTLTKAGLAGALGAGLSAAYNLLRESTPSILTPVVPTAEPVAEPAVVRPTVAPVVTPIEVTEPTPEPPVVPPVVG